MSEPTPQSPPREYLGDSVYVAWLPQDGMLQLYTDTGYGPTNVIFLEASVFIELLKFAARYPQWIPPTHRAA